MSRSRQDSNDYYDTLNNDHLHRALRTESNVNQQSSFDNSSPQLRTNHFSSENSYTNRVLSNRAEDSRERDNYRNRDDIERVVYRNPHLRVNDGLSGGFSGEYIAENQTIGSNTREVVQQSSQMRPSQHTTPANYTSRRTNTTNYTSEPIRQTIPVNGRGCVIDINITVTSGGRTPHAAVNTINRTSRTPIRPTTTTTFDNVHYIDLDLRTPPNTATFSTDGNARPSS